MTTKFSDSENILDLYMGTATDNVVVPGRDYNKILDELIAADREYQAQLDAIMAEQGHKFGFLGILCYVAITMTIVGITVVLLHIYA